MKPLIIAHRGYSAKFPENTLAAFEAAINSGCQMIELDVHFSKDCELMVFHDLKLRRMTGRKKTINDYPACQLQAWSIPTLKEVLQLVARRVPVNIEIKYETIQSEEMRRLLATKLLALLDETGTKKHVLVSSFDDAILRELRAQDSTLALGILAHAHPRPALKKTLIEEIRPLSYHPSYRGLRLEHVQFLKQSGLKVFAYTANTKRQFQKLCALGVEGIITNEVEKLRDYLEHQ